MLDPALVRKCVAEFVGTTILVFFGAGVLTVVLGFRAYGGSIAAGMLTTGLTFGLLLTGLFAVIGPISGCHVNPAVTLAALLNKRVSPAEALGYCIAQVIGAIVGALLLLWVLASSPFYSKAREGLGANGYGSLSLLHMSAGGTFLAEVLMTAAFVLIVLSATRKEANAAFAGLTMGFALALVNTIGFPIDGTSVNPARSIGPAIITAGQPIRQIWVFILAPLVGSVLAAGLYLLFHPRTWPAGAASAASASTADPAATTDQPPPPG